jgi:hypothetical protein
MSSSYEDDDDISESGTMDHDSTGNCIRNRSNFSIIKPFHIIDKMEFDADMLNLYIENDASPKLKLLMKNIKKLDAKDLKTSGKHYKHMIFTDVNRSAYGVKIIASALASNGMHMILHPQGTGFSVYDDDKLLETRGNNFGVLISKAFYDRPMNVKIRKTILDKFNARPDNIYGDLMRFIILDQGFKEGIDLYDVKYIHLFEPLTDAADEKQAIGRGTRFCGQKGLEFHPTLGWPLYVFKYDVTVPEQFSQHKTLFDLYLSHTNIDLRKIVFSAELESVAIEASVDYELNQNVHTFDIDKPSPILSKMSPVSGGGENSNPPARKMNLDSMRQYIRKNFGEFSYPPLKLENNCGSIVGGSSNIVSFTPTQNFVRHYFQPSSAYKGCLFYHSVGTGKTCSAIATATTSFDVEGYTILWVTRHTLKSDIWKNMYNQVCSIDIQNKIRNGFEVPNKISNKLRYISGNWMEPISYKQFSNMLLKKNKIYNEMVHRNGSDDPLKKTLLIVDEAHKIYSPGVSKNEKPNSEILEQMIQQSYEKSGADSVRVLLMTATPFTQDGMEMIQLLNLLREGDKLETDFQEFSREYLNPEGYFTARGKKQFQDKISGYISYLNRSKDARNFAHPVIENVYAPMSMETSNKEKPKNKYDVKLKDLRENFKTINEELKVLSAAKKLDAKANKEESKQKFKQCTDDVTKVYNEALATAAETRKQEEGKCKELPVKNRKECKDKAIGAYKNKQLILKIDKDTGLIKCKEIKTIKNSNDDRLDVLRRSVSKYRTDIQDVTAEKKERANATKKIREEIKTPKADLKDTQREYKALSDEIKERIKAFNVIVDKKDRANAVREFRKSSDDIKYSKELKSKIKYLKLEVSKKMNKLKNMQYADGKRRLDKISQAYAMKKYCGI